MTQPAISGPAAGGNAQPGTGAPSGAAPGGAAPIAQAAPPAWLEGVAPDLTGWVNEQGFQTPSDALSAHRGLLRLRGVPERELLRLPEKWDETPAAAEAIYTRLGRPDKPDGYEIPDVVIGDGDRNLADDFRKWSHEAGLSKTQAKKLATQYQATVQAFATERQGKLEAKLASEAAALKAEWGGEYANNVSAGSRAFAAIGKAIGLSSDDLGAMESSIGHAKTMKLMALVGRTMGEHPSVAGDGEGAGQFGMTPAAATAKANTLIAERSKMKREDPRYNDISDEIQRLYHVATGESVPDFLKRPGPRS